MLKVNEEYPYSEYNLVVMGGGEGQVHGDREGSGGQMDHRVFYTPTDDSDRDVNRHILWFDRARTIDSF